ncbi:MAG: hypothetical protein P8Y69_16915 [Gammaproteobacteria bacterium]
MANLLALRDGEENPSVARELDGDAVAARELVALTGIRDGLRALPDIEPDAAVWDRVQSAPSRSEVRSFSVRPSSRGTRAPVALAAGMLLAVALGLVAVVWLQPGTSTEVLAGPEADPTLQALYRRSQELEGLWHDGRRMPDATELAYLYRIADLDGQLALVEPAGGRDSRRAEQLWNRRVELMESLAEVRRARAAQPAVYVY